MTRRMSILIGALLLSACGGPPKNAPPALPAAPVETGPTEAPAPKPAPGLDWFFNGDGGQGKLAYGPPNSDDIHLMLACKAKSGQVTVARSVLTEHAGTPPRLSLASGTARGTWLATTATSPEAGHTDLTVTTSSADPVLQAFARHGWISVVTDGETEGLAPQPGNKAIREFFAYCG
jgi:hypothetical protein